MEKILKKIVVFTCLLSFLAGVIKVDFPAFALGSNDIPKGTATIDGKIDDIWENASKKIEIIVHNQGRESKNASGWARLMWDESNLYVLGYVSDKTPSNNVKLDAWHTDSFEFFIDEQNKHIAIDKYIDQFRVDRNGTFSGMIAHTIATEEEFKETYKGLKWAIKQVDGSTDYVVEYKIPWVKITPKADSTKIGVAFQINDDYDNDGIILDGLINSEVTDTWDPSSYPEMKLVSEKAGASDNENKDSDTSSTDKGDSESKHNYTSSDSDNDKSDSSSKDNGDSSKKDDSNASAPKDDSDKNNSKDSSQKDDSDKENSKDSSQKDDSNKDKTNSSDDDGSNKDDKANNDTSSDKETSSPNKNDDEEDSDKNNGDNEEPTKNTSASSKDKNNSSKDESKNTSGDSENDAAEDADDTYLTDEEIGEDDNVTTVTEPVNEKLLNTVIIVAVAAVIAVGMLCATAILIVYKKK